MTTRENEYLIICTCRGYKALEDMVNQSLKKGFKPMGGITVDNDMLLQAVYKDLIRG